MIINWRRVVAFGLLVVGVAIAAACGNDDGEDGSVASPATTRATAVADDGFPVELRNSDGSTLTVNAPPQRIVSLSPGATEILYAIGAEEALVAVDHQADYPEAAAGFATKVDAYEPSIETIAGLEPDLAIVANDDGGIVGALGRLNIPVFYLDLDTDVTSIDDVIGQIVTLGRITGATEEATALSDSLQARLDAIERSIAKSGMSPPLSVYHELDSTYYSVADQTFIGSIYAELAAENIAGDGGGTAYPQLTQEAIIAANPSVIVLADEEFGVTIESVKARPGWDAIDAVKNDRIYAVDPDIISRPGPRIVDALEQLARQLYPEAFE